MYSQTEIDEAVAAGALTPEAATALRTHIEQQRHQPTAGRRAIQAHHRLQRHFRVDRRGDPAVRGRLYRPVGRRADRLGDRGDGPVVPRPAPHRDHQLVAGAVLHGQAADGPAVDPSAARLHRQRLRDRRHGSGRLASARCRSTTTRNWRGDRSAPFRQRSRRLRPGCTGGASAFRSPSPPAPPPSPPSSSASSSQRSATRVEQAKNLILGFVLLLGIGTFLFAMWWDSSDRARLTRRADVAFWLHLLAAPMIVHPVFTLLGLNDGNATDRRRAASSSCSTS